MVTPEATAFASWLAVPVALSPSIPAALGTSTWLVVSVMCATIFGLLLAYWRREPLDRGWVPAGMILAALGVAAWVGGAGAGWHWGLSVTGPTRSLLAAVIAVDTGPLDWGALMVAGIPAGAWLAARTRGPVTWRTVPPTFVRRAFGGTLMGVGGTLAAGCNIGNALTGLSVLALNSAIATVGMAAGVAAAVLIEHVGRARSRMRLAEERR
jgi:uncharacterized protein